MGIDAKLPEKPLEPGTASPKQKNMILALAAQKDLFSFDTKKDTSKLEEFCDSNGYNLKELTFEEAEVLDLIVKYEPKKHDEVQDVEFTEVTESTEENIEGQVSLL